MAADTEEVRRLAARAISDCGRGIPFAVGIRHFIEFVIRALEVMDAKLERMEKIAKGDNHDTEVPGAP